MSRFRVLQFNMQFGQIWDDTYPDRAPVRLDATLGTLDVLAADFAARTPVTPDLSANHHGTGRELFEAFRRNVGPATSGAGVVV